MVVHGHEDEVPADAARTPSAVAGDTVADLVEAPRLLDVDVQQLARVVALVGKPSINHALALGAIDV